MDTYNADTNVTTCMLCPSGTNTQTLTGQTTQNACGKTEVILACIVLYILDNRIFYILRFVKITLNNHDESFP